MKKHIFLIAFLITLFLFVTVIFTGIILDKKRTNALDDRTQQTFASLNEMQTFFLLSEAYGDKMACLAFENKLQDLDKSLWDLGRKIDEYRVATEEFQKDPYYLEQKRVFNENEMTYLLLLTDVKKRCDFKDEIIIFFYKNAEDCTKCDDESFVLTDINKDIDPEIAIFSFDMDLNITAVKLLSEYYKINEYPCTIISDKSYCGMHDKNYLLRSLCDANENISICPKILANDQAATH